MGILRFFIIGAGLLLITALVATMIGSARWQADTDTLIKRLHSGQIAGETTLNREEEIRNLPPVVQRYFRSALPENFRVIRGVQIEHQGTFNMGEEEDRWIDFTSQQWVTTNRPGFVWNAKMPMFLGLPVLVHDAYVAREGILKPAILGLFALTDLKGGGEIAEGELMRFLAEAAWYPTLLLPCQGVRWAPVDERSAKATLVDGPNSVTLLFSFDDAGLIYSVKANARGRTVGDKIVATPWEGRWRDYQNKDGFNAPMSGEVAWFLPDGRKPYWRGNIKHIAFEYQ
jgi:hypothetical protein